MNPFARGVRNAFRNSVRTVSIVAILGLCIGLSLTMLVAKKAVDNKISSVKSAIGNTISIAPAGFNPGAQANNALTSSELSGVKSITHVSGLTETLSDRLPTTGSSLPTFGRNSSSAGSTTSLTSPVALNNSSGGSDGGPRFFVSGGSSSLPTNFSLPVSFLGTTDGTHVNDASISLSSGTALDTSKDANDALISSQMASKNSLHVGSTFTAYGTSLTVAGIFSSSTQGSQDTVVLPLPALQRLSGQSGVVTSATATVDSLDNLAATTAAIKSKLGSGADVTSAQEQADNTVQPLNSVKSVATFSLIGAAIAGAIIIVLTMIMVVRERKREIGVTKAIGGSNARIIGEFTTESLTLAVLGAVLGLIIGVIGGQPVTNTLVTNSSNTSATQTSSQGRMARFDGGQGSTSTDRPTFRSFRNNAATRSFTSIRTQVGWGILLDGFGAAILIAAIGSALAAGMISRVQPSNVMRAE